MRQHQQRALCQIQCFPVVQVLGRLRAASMPTRTNDVVQIAPALLTLQDQLQMLTKPQREPSIPSDIYTRLGLQSNAEWQPTTAANSQQGAATQLSQQQVLQTLLASLVQPVAAPLTLQASSVMQQQQGVPGHLDAASMALLSGLGVGAGATAVTAAVPAQPNLEQLLALLQAQQQ